MLTQNVLELARNKSVKNTINLPDSNSALKFKRRLFISGSYESRVYDNMSHILVISMISCIKIDYNRILIFAERE